MHQYKTFLLIALVILSGCSMKPEYEKPEIVTPRIIYLNSDAVEGTTQFENVEQGWWRWFKDPLLDKLVKDAQRQNISLQVATQRIRGAQAYQAAVASFKVPTVSMGAGFSSYQLSENEALLGPAITAQNPMTGGDLNLVDQQNTMFSAGLNVSWEFDLFGRIDALADAASIRVEQAEAFRQGVVIIITSEVIGNYIQFRGAQARKQIAIQNIKDQEKTLELVKTNMQSGLVSAMEVARAEALLAATQAILPQLETAEKAHLYRLGMLLGKSPYEISDLMETYAPVPTLSGIIPIGMSSDLLKRRPDIRVTELEMAATNAELGAAIANKYPKFYLTGGPGVVAEDFDDLFSSGSGAWGFGVGVNWNIFDAGRMEAAQEMAEVRFENSALIYQQTVLNAFGEVETMLVNYGNSQRFNNSLKRADTMATRALKKATTLYESGLIDHLSLLDAQRQKNLVSDMAVTSEIQVANSVVTLYKALGGSWEIKE